MSRRSLGPWRGSFANDTSTSEPWYGRRQGQIAQARPLPVRRSLAQVSTMIAVDPRNTPLDPALRHALPADGHAELRAAHARSPGWRGRRARPRRRSPPSWATGRWRDWRTSSRPRPRSPRSGTRQVTRPRGPLERALGGAAPAQREQRHERTFVSGNERHLAFWLALPAVGRSATAAPKGQRRVSCLDRCSRYSPRTSSGRSPATSDGYRTNQGACPWTHHGRTVRHVEARDRRHPAPAKEPDDPLS